jgi:single-strand DNA-binding protein
MPNFNRLIFVGHFTRDPALKYLPSQTAVCEFGLAANRKWKDQGGTEHNEVCYLDFAAFGKQGEVINHYCRKGSGVLVEGRMKYDVWDGQDGKKHSKVSCIVEKLQFISKCDGGNSAAPEPPAGESPPAYEPPASAEDDVPF